jgi:SAM-dependent methyltransferase/uncharacterized protein YbaR (Trm112 family)
VKRAALQFLCCPACQGDLDLVEAAAEGDDVMAGTLACVGCDAAYPVARGVPRFAGEQSGAAARTADAFGYQWKRYRELADRYRRQFLDWVKPVDEHFFADRVVLEGGCGKGRHSAVVAELGARAVVAMDLSEAVDSAFENTRHLDNVHVVQADLNQPPVRAVFDYAFSVGVLHHLPEPQRGFHALVSRLRPGGYISAWVYGREGNGWIVKLVSPVREQITSRMPHRWLDALSVAVTLPLFAATRLIYRPVRTSILGRRLPYAAYLGYISGFPFREQRTIVFDHLVAPVAYYIPRDEFAAWFERAGLEAVSIEHHNANSWRGFARVPAPVTAI